MPFIPHTRADVSAMLQRLGVDDLESLFDEIPQHLRAAELGGIERGESEMEVSRELRAAAARDASRGCFIGAGAYEHHIPAAVWEIASRSEFYTAYTPYQAESSQGNLQLIFEYQSMMASLMALDVSNASMYDGASALAEAVLMAARIQRRCPTRRILIPRSVHPAYRSVVKTMTDKQDIEVVTLDYQPDSGAVCRESLQREAAKGALAIVIPQANFFGVLEDVDRLLQVAVEHDLVSIGLVNPMLCALLRPPGEWGQVGVDIACGEGQPLGIPLSSGGPYFGFLTCREKHLRQLPGRLVGRTVDREGKPGFTLTLQAREQHIRRARATSNICTNQGLMVTAATIHMALLGATGLRRVAEASLANTELLADRLCALEGVQRIFHAHHAHDIVLKLPCATAAVLDGLATAGYSGGYDMCEFYPELGHAVMVCATETKSEAEIDAFVRQFDQALQSAITSNHAPLKNPKDGRFRGD